MIHLWSMAALAAPHFVGAAEDTVIAAIAWDAARECTGRDGLATATVEITRRTNAGDYLGVARTDPDSGLLYRIDLNTDDGRRREVLVHEVTHAWVSAGPVALVEGTAERIADCVVSRRPSLAPLQFDDGRDLDGLPDLLAWSKPTEGAPSELHSVRTDAYVGASRLLRTAEAILPPGTLWADRTTSWDGFLSALGAVGPRGEELAAVIGGGAAAQRAALADRDRDGLTAIAERWAGTSDSRYDTDGDGFWDGALPPAGAVALPLDGTPVCGGSQPGPQIIGGELRGAHLPEVVARRAPGAGSRPLLVSLSSPPPIGSTGGWWVVTSGPIASSCRSSLRATAWAEDPALSSLAGPVHDALLTVLVETESRWEEGPQRVAVALGGAQTRVEGEVVWLASDEVLRELGAGGPQAIARTAVAARRLWVQGDRDWTAVEAVASSLSR